ncbi:hypothetical protein [Helicobacter bilis]|uniref:Uncharacterized protein n=1 Tax=Helicobacter bilis TaxID=37372 RepID=A0A4U8U6U6_9HELI|nr:hypothetical protein [Helicobacter bilis]MDD7297497.1 hypothetical protein [Helicobacter bilis]TLE07469.1 hypothetical protein LS78_009145 [Helicobacter bilis]TLE09087.1 hypothetical protein LS79_008710 [Helicobacter bilis]
MIEGITNYYKAYITDEYTMRDKLKDIKTKLMNARNEILKNLSTQSKINKMMRQGLIYLLH